MMSFGARITYMEVHNRGCNAIIDQDKCTGCGLCVSVCYCGALVMVGNVVTVIEVEECGWCTQCEVVCPVEAISCPFEIIKQH